MDIVGRDADRYPAFDYGFERRLRSHRDVEITLVNRENFFVLTPLLSGFPAWWLRRDAADLRSEMHGGPCAVTAQRLQRPDRR